MKNKFLGLTRYEKLNWIAMSIKSLTFIIGSQMVLDGINPYYSITMFAIGGIANEYVSILKGNEAKKNDKKL